MSDQPKDPKPISFERVLEVLEKGKVDSEHGLMRWSSNYTFLISVAHEDVSLMAIYKPQKGERPLWDFPDGTLCYRERAAFLASEQLGWRLVPPTVLREGPRGLGSVQFYIEHDPDINYFSFTETMLPQLSRMVAFDYIINNADRKGGHCLVDSDGHLWGIDHGISFHSAHKLRTVIWDFAGQAIPDGLLGDVERLCGLVENTANPFREELLCLISQGELNSFRARIRHILKYRKYPTPGPGPNYPWPPV